MRDVVGDLTPDTLGQASAHNPPWIPSATAIPMSTCVAVVIREEWEHHGFATRDLAVLVEARLTSANAHRFREHACPAMPTGPASHSGSYGTGAQSSGSPSVT